MHYIKTEASVTHFHEVRPQLVTMLQLKGRYIDTWKDDEALLPWDAGVNTIRGFDSIGPRDKTTGDPLGGKLFASATAELQFPLPVLPQDLGFSAAIFAEAAVLTDTDADQFGVDVQDDSSIRSSVGFSILWDSPFGLLRGDVGFALTKEDYDDTKVFTFGGGTRF